MPHCEMCGDDVDSLQRAKVSGAELEVCDNCVDFGTSLEDNNDDKDETSTKYDTSSSNSPRQDSTGNSQSSTRGSDFGSMPGQLAPDYGDRIRKARTRAGHSIEDLADHLNEKASHLRKVEQGARQPDNNLQAQIEDFLGVDLSMDEEEFDTPQ